MRPHWAVQYDCWSKSMVCVLPKILLSVYGPGNPSDLQCHHDSGRIYDVVGGAYRTHSFSISWGRGVKIMGSPAWFNESELRSPLDLARPPDWQMMVFWCHVPRRSCWHKLGGDGRYGWQLTPVETVTRWAKWVGEEEQNKIAIQGGFAWVCVLF